MNTKVVYYVTNNPFRGEGLKFWQIAFDRESGYLSAHFGGFRGFGKKADKIAKEWEEHGWKLSTTPYNKGTFFDWYIIDERSATDEQFNFLINSFVRECGKPMTQAEVNTIMDMVHAEHELSDFEIGDKIIRY